MLLYADSKLAQIKQLVDELNQNAQEAKTLLSSSNIQSAIQNSFNELTSSTNTKFASLQSNLENHLNTTLTHKTQELETQNTQALGNFVREFLNDDKIKTLISVESIQNKAIEDFITQNTQNITQGIKNTLTTQLQETLTNQLRQDLEQKTNQTLPTLTNELSQAMSQKLQEVLDTLEISKIPLDENQISQIAQSLLDEGKVINTLRVEFSKTLNEKLTQNTDFKNLIEQKIQDSILNFRSTQAMEFRYFLLKTNTIFSDLLIGISHANTIVTTNALADLELEYKKKLEHKRQEYLESLKNPNAPYHNVYQKI